VTVLWGDVNLSSKVDASDSAAILNAITGGKASYGDYTVGEEFAGSYIWGDVNISSKVDASDSATILNAITGGKAVYGDFTVGEESVVE
jgi:hypothetical protein